MNVHDPFREHRQNGGVIRCPFHGEEIAMLLRHKDVRMAAKDFETFSSDAPFRVPIPSEEDVRTMRQLPIETNPPEHTDYRKITEPFFLRPKSPRFIARMEALIAELLEHALGCEQMELVNEFALPLQSRALTYLLNVAESEADIWIGWGIHVFKVTGGEFKKGTLLEDYLHSRFDRAEAEPPRDDFFSTLAHATYRGRPLDRDEMMGFANLAFAGGRDTVIHMITCVLHFLAENPEALEYLRQDSDRIVLACEEFFRVYMPLTQIGRVCPKETTVNGVTIQANHRISLCWASANMDEEAFEEPHSIRLDRRPNPHVTFGFGVHLCSGAHHARLILRTLLRYCCERVERIVVLEAKQRVEHEVAFDRRLGYDSLIVRMYPRNDS